MFFDEANVFTGILIVGTGLPLKIVTIAGSSSAKPILRGPMPIVFTDIGQSMNLSREAYIRRYLTLSENDASDQHLLERTLYWFSGR
jgi:hypothetical protein